MTKNPAHVVAIRSLINNTKDLLSAINDSQILISEHRIIEVTSLMEESEIPDGRREGTRQAFLECAQRLWSKYPVSASRIETAVKSFDHDSKDQETNQEVEKIMTLEELADVLGGTVLIQKGWDDGFLLEILDKTGRTCQIEAGSPGLHKAAIGAGATLKEARGDLVKMIRGKKLFYKIESGERCYILISSTLTAQADPYPVDTNVQMICPQTLDPHWPMDDGDRYAHMHCKDEGDCKRVPVSVSETPTGVLYLWEKFSKMPGGDKNPLDTSLGPSENCLSVTQLVAVRNGEADSILTEHLESCQFCRENIERLQLIYS